MSDNEAPPRLDLLITLIVITLFNIFLIFDSIDSRNSLKQRDDVIETLRAENAESSVEIKKLKSQLAVAKALMEYSTP